MVPVEESPQEENLNGDAMIEDEGSFCSNVGVSSTAVSPKPILIPAHALWERLVLMNQYKFSVAIGSFSVLSVLRYFSA